MGYSTTKLFVGIALLVASTQAAWAQMGAGPMGPMGPTGPQTPAGDEKKEGVAVEAPKTTGQLPTTPTLPPPSGRRKRWKLIDFNGYYRLRMDWFKNFNLGFNDSPGLGGAPFPRALGCGSTMLGHPCNDSVGGENMRLRLEPVINIDEGTSVHIQADALDNMVLGSTPYENTLGGVYSGAVAPPVGAFGDNQTAPLQGVNSDRPSLVVKRVWAEVNVPIGILKFGRMPNQWGMGIYANGGGYDPINGTYDYDADYGDTVDRVSFTAGIPGTPLRAMLAFDWNYTGLASNQLVATNKGNEGHPFDLDDSDDATSWVAVVSKLDTPQDFRDTTDRGDIAADYGVYFQYKTQAWDLNLTNMPAGTFDPMTGYEPRSLTEYTASLWGKVGIGHHLFEAELVGHLGSLDKVMDLNGSAASMSIEKFGGAARWTWRALEDKLHLGFESGFATGDQWDNTPQGNTNIAYANLLGGPGDTSLSQFFFNRDYHVDMILWRRLVGAVTNAAYFKPFGYYDVTKSIRASLSNVSSVALNPVATPGNSSFYGTEFDSEVGYNTGKFYLGIAYGVYFPFGAMAHPTDQTGQGGPGFGYPTTDANGNPVQTGDAGTAHCIQIRSVLVF